MLDVLSAEDKELRQTDTHMPFSIASSEVFHVVSCADGDATKDAEAPVHSSYSLKKEGNKYVKTAFLAFSSLAAGKNVHRVIPSFPLKAFMVGSSRKHQGILRLMLSRSGT